MFFNHLLLNNVFVRIRFDALQFRYKIVSVCIQFDVLPSSFRKLFWFVVILMVFPKFQSIRKHRIKTNELYQE